MLTVSHVYAGYSDHFQRYKDSEHLLYAYYCKDTSLQDIIDQLTDDCFMGPVGEMLPEKVTRDDVREALLSMLTDMARENYTYGMIVEYSANSMSDGDDVGYESPIFVVDLRWE